MNSEITLWPAFSAEFAYSTPWYQSNFSDLDSNNHYFDFETTNEKTATIAYWSILDYFYSLMKYQSWTLLYCI